MKSIDESLKILEELESLYNSDNIRLIGELCNRLATLSVHIGKEYTQAYKNAAEAKDEYEYKLAKYIMEAEAVTKAEREGKAKFAEEKKLSTKSDSVAKSLQVFLARIDRVLDTYKQYQSNIKATDLKHI